MRKDPLLSIVIPVYNAKGYLGKCLSSVENQGFPENYLEIICVDDGSTDGSGAWLDDHAQDHSEVRVIHKANGGECSARNSGLEMLSGKYFAFVDADDMLIPHSIYDIVNAMEQEQCDVAQFNFTTIERKRPGKKKYRLARMTLSGSVWRYIFSREKFGNLRFDEKLSYAGDTFFAQTIALNNPRCLSTSRVCYVYNDANPSSVMSNRRFSDVAENMLMLAENHKQYLDQKTYPNSMKRVEIWCARATAAYIFYYLRAGVKEAPFDMLKERGLWPYRKEWDLLIPHLSIRQTISNYCLFFVGIRPLWDVFNRSGIFANK